jgi:D-alanyl-lipoteichoic acid acyltransferase DltB (MBOAT superfamily)
VEITSLKFAILAIISVFIFYLLSPKYRIGYLALLSCGFIATFNYYLLIYVVTYSLINYILGRTIPDSKYKKALFRTGIIINLTQLIILKYSSFAIDPIFQAFSSTIHVSKLSEIIIPIGISYFTLQGIGYLINIKMGWEKPEKSFLNFLLYITFYPKYLSGPIERSNHFLPQLSTLSSFNRQNITEGFRLMLSGFLKKVVIANQLSLIVNPVYNDINASGGGVLMLVILIQPLYLYFDFSGYTDIAIGIARTFGIKLLPNFDRPFFSQNVTTFWKRFHMSLAFWFNDYIFKQVSFRFRKWKANAAVFAVFITWILFVIWHGAGWNFMVLGLLQALAINFEFFTKRKRQDFFSKIPAFWGKWMGRLVTYLFYGVSLIFFFSPDLKTTLLYFDRLRCINISFPITTAPIIIADKITFFAAVGIMIILLIIEMISCDMKEKYEKIEVLWNSNRIKLQFLRFAIYYILLLLIFYFGGMQTEFVYFQF